MKKLSVFSALSVALLVLACASAKSVQTKRTDIFVSNKDGYSEYHSPALLVTGKGALLVFVAGQNGDLNNKESDILLKRSLDNGVTWDDARKIVSGNGHEINSPIPVLDRVKGVVWLMMLHDDKNVLVMRSEDDGETWNEPVDVTKDVLPPSWEKFIIGPGHGIQLNSGKLVVPCKHIDNEEKKSCAVISGDSGETWSRSEPLEDILQMPNGNKEKDAKIYLDMRNNFTMKQLDSKPDYAELPDMNLALIYEIGENRPGEKITLSLMMIGQDQTPTHTETQKDDSHRFDHITFLDNSGESPENAVIIQNARGEQDGVASEYYYLDIKFGRRGRDWQLSSQSLISVDGKKYDKMDIKLSDGTEKTIFFDITGFFGKM